MLPEFSFCKWHNHELSFEATVYSQVTSQITYLLNAANIREPTYLGFTISVEEVYLQM